MRYLITQTGYDPVFAPYFDAENNFEDGMTVYDIFARLYTTDGKNWKPVEQDTL